MEAPHPRQLGALRAEPCAAAGWFTTWVPSGDPTEEAVENGQFEDSLHDLLSETNWNMICFHSYVSLLEGTEKKIAIGLDFTNKETPYKHACKDHISWLHAAIFPAPIFQLSEFGALKDEAKVPRFADSQPTHWG